jgi:putative ATPase
MVGQRHLLDPGAPLRILVEQDRLTSAILWGPPGTGKTTLASVIAARTSKAFVTLSAVIAGVADVRAEIAAARRRLGERDRGTVLFIDEVHRFSRPQQDVLLPAVEEGLVVLLGATTENPFFALEAPLLSRSTLWRLEPLSDADVAELVRRGLELEGRRADEGAVEALVSLADGDARAALGTLETALALSGESPIDRGSVERARAGRLYHQGADAHFDQASAFIKSIRGSDPDAGLYWMARLLEAGEDPRFLARRLVILASEDVGLADPMALVVAEAAARALEHVGLPEARLNLAEAVVYLACCPKSNRVTVALSRAVEDVRHGRRGDVPPYLRDSHSASAPPRGEGEEYEYPHQDARGMVAQRYMPAGLEDRVYYEPGPHGVEPELAKRIEQARELRSRG